MLENILEEEDDAFVFFYEDNDTDAHTMLEELEQVWFSYMTIMTKMLTQCLKNLSR